MRSILIQNRPVAPPKLTALRGTDKGPACFLVARGLRVKAPGSCFDKLLTKWLLRYGGSKPREAEAWGQTHEDQGRAGATLLPVRVEAQWGGCFHADGLHPTLGTSLGTPYPQAGCQTLPRRIMGRCARQTGPPFPDSGCPRTRNTRSRRGPEQASRVSPLRRAHCFGLKAIESQ